MTYRFGSGLFVIPNQVLNLIQDLRISGSRFWLRIWVLKRHPLSRILYFRNLEGIKILVVISLAKV